MQGPRATSNSPIAFCICSWASISGTASSPLNLTAFQACNVRMAPLHSRAPIRSRVNLQLTRFSGL